MAEYRYFDRDISWLYFNERVLEEAADSSVPLIERIRFLGIYSSNLDEFYRVRMPVLMALHEIKIPGNDQQSYYSEASTLISKQLDFFGSTLRQQIIPALKENNICLVYNEPVPTAIKAATDEYFYNVLAAYTEIIDLEKDSSFFPENNKLYIAVAFNKAGKAGIRIVNIPSAQVSRFFTITAAEKTYIVFIDDIIKNNLSFIFPGGEITGAYSIKVTRDAELDLQDEFEGDIAEKIETQISRRDYGLATRFLYQPDMPEAILAAIIQQFKLSGAGIVQGGFYHNLKDLSAFPLSTPALLYTKQPPVNIKIAAPSLLAAIQQKDILVHPPYQSYDTVLRFFNEAAINENVEEIYTTMYRVANDSRIVHALISAAKNGKKVTAFVELKARFDEANNIKWAKVMKAAGVKIIYSIPKLKVHAKVALVKKKDQERMQYIGLLATGNLNESTAKFYTDHILLTANGAMLRELELLFIFLSQRKKTDDTNKIKFEHLLVAQFNLQKKFLSLIDNEISNAQKGLPAGITIKLNNLEEEVLINKLYEASNAGVKINLVVRSICRIVPGMQNMSDNITVKRIVDRYLEHGRIFIFTNGGSELYFLGSSDWMNRNIYRRIEVCFPLYNKQLQQQVREIINLQLNDNAAAVMIDEHLKNVRQPATGTIIRSQLEIYKLLQKNNHEN
ncbi:polyphosphate kinase 1 [Ferruginibacter sp.]